MTAKKTKETAAKKPGKKGTEFSLKIKLKPPPKKREVMKKNPATAKKAATVTSTLGTKAKSRPKKKQPPKKSVAKKPRRSSRSSNDADESSESVQGEEQSDSNVSVQYMPIEDVTPISPASSHVSVIPIEALSHSSSSNTNSSSSDEDRPRPKKGHTMGSVAAAVKGRRRSVRSKYAPPPILIGESTGEEMSDSLGELSPPSLVTDSSGPSEESDDSAKVPQEVSRKENRAPKKLFAKSKETVEKPKEDEQAEVSEELIEEEPPVEEEKPKPPSARKMKREKQKPEKIDTDDPVILVEHISRRDSVDELDSKKVSKERKHKTKEKSSEKTASVESTDRKSKDEQKSSKSSKAKEEKKSRKKSKERSDSTNKERHEASPSRKKISKGLKEAEKVHSVENKSPKKRRKSEKGAKEFDEVEESSSARKGAKGEKAPEDAKEVIEVATTKEKEHLKESNKRKLWDEAITAAANLSNKSPKKAKKARRSSNIEEQEVQSPKKAVKEEKHSEGDKRSSRLKQESKENLQPAYKEKYADKHEISPKRQKIKRFWRSCLPEVLPERDLLPNEWQSLEKKIWKRYNPKQRNGHIYPIVDDEEALASAPEENVYATKEDGEAMRKRDERMDAEYPPSVRDESPNKSYSVKDQRDKHKSHPEREDKQKAYLTREDREDFHKDYSREDSHRPYSVGEEREDVRKPYSMREEKDTRKPYSMRDEGQDIRKPYSMRDEREDIRRPYSMRDEREGMQNVYSRRNEKDDTHKLYSIREELEERFKTYNVRQEREDPLKAYSVRDESKNKPYPMREEGNKTCNYPMAEPSVSDRNLVWQEAMRRLQQTQLEVPVFPSDVPKKVENKEPDNEKKVESADASHKEPPRFRTYSPPKTEIKTIHESKKSEVKSCKSIEKTLGTKSNKSVAYFLSMLSEGEKEETKEEEEDGNSIPTHEIPLPPSRDPRSQPRNSWSSQQSQQPDSDSDMSLPYESVALPGQPAPPDYEQIDENIYYVERKKSKQSKEVRRMQCDCTLADECGDDCLNRLLMIECGSTCPVGPEKCLNRQFAKRMYSKCEPFSTEFKGRGLAAAEDIAAGSFVMEYVGEVINGREFNRRVKHYGQSATVHTYFMALKGDWIVDATRKGNASRFINHSCDPNAETQKWTVNGELRVGFFSRKFIASGEEITFDYQFQNYGREPQKCFCGSVNCRGWLSKPADQMPEQEEEEEEEKERKKRTKDENDMDFGKELAKLEASGIRNRAHTLTVARIMIRAESVANRKRLLQLLLNADEPCKRLFLDYHGLPLLWTWMVDHSASLRLEILRLLEMLPIPDKTMLKNSKVLSVVEKWVQEPASVPSTPSSTESDPQRPASDDSELSNKDDEGMSQEQEVGVADLATKLIANWSSLSELFKIPKKSELLVSRKQHELEADRGYREKHHENTKDRLRYGIMPKRSEEEKSRLKRNNWDRVWDIPRLEENRKEVEQRANNDKEQESLEERFERAQNVWEDHKDNCLSLCLDPQKTPIFSRDLTQVFNLATAEWVDIPEEHCEQLRSLDNPYCMPPTLGLIMHHPQAIVGNPTVISPDRIPLLPPTIIISPEGLTSTTTTTAAVMPPKQPKPKKNNQWKKAIDPKGREYFYNIVTRKSQWVPPEEWGEEDSGDSDSDDDDNSEETTTDDSDDDDSDSEEEEDERKTTSLVQEHIISPRNDDSSDEYREIAKKIRKTKEKSLKRKMMLQQQQQQEVRKQQEAARKQQQQQRPDAAYDPSEDLSDMESSGGSDYEERIKDKFKTSVADVIVRALNPHRRNDCMQGRITSNEDFKHLAKKLTHFVMLKELKQIRSVEELFCSESVKHKAKEFVRKYMNKFPEEYTRADSFL